VHERPRGKSEAGAEGAGNDRSVRAFFAFPTRACGHGASGGPRAGSDEHSHAEWLATHGDLSDGLPREMLLAGSGLERDLVGRETRQTTGGPGPRLVLDPELIVEVDPKGKILEQAGLNTAGSARPRNGSAALWRTIDSPHPRDECSHSQSDARTDRGGAERSNDDAVRTPFVRADCQRAQDREHPGPNKCALAERVAAHGDLANGFARETLLACISLNRHLIAREAGEPPSGLDPQLILNAKLIVEVDPKREVLKGLKCLSPALRRCQQDEGNDWDEPHSAQTGS